MIAIQFLGGSSSNPSYPSGVESTLPSGMFITQYSGMHINVHVHVRMSLFCTAYIIIAWTCHF